MVRATTPQRQMQVFREEALRVNGLLEARKLVERIETAKTIWETRLSYSEERLSETEAMFSSLEEQLDERLREEVLRRESEKVRLVRKDCRLFHRNANVLIYDLEDKHEACSDNDDQDLGNLEAGDKASESVNQIGRNVSQESSGESHLHQKRV